MNAEATDQYNTAYSHNLTGILHKYVKCLIDSVLPYKYVAEWRKNGRKDIPKYILAAEAILDFVGSLRKKIRNYE